MLLVCFPGLPWGVALCFVCTCVCIHRQKPALPCWHSLDQVSMLLWFTNERHAWPFFKTKTPILPRPEQTSSHAHCYTINCLRWVLLLTPFQMRKPVCRDNLSKRHAANGRQPGSRAHVLVRAKYHKLCLLWCQIELGSPTRFALISV